jgi:hypothetical protein
MTEDRGGAETRRRNKRNDILDDDDYELRS